jgi:uncharacterized repeat protein (TIGR04138 family)
MPPKKQQSKPARPKSLQHVVDAVGLYPAEAYEFIQHGLSYTVQRIHGADDNPKANRHVSGPQLCEGLREFALHQYGLMARAVLRRWNLTCTLDFGRIVFALVEAGHMQKTDEDTLEDFKGVFDFRAAFDAKYRIGTELAKV